MSELHVNVGHTAATDPPFVDCGYNPTAAGSVRQTRTNPGAGIFPLESVDLGHTRDEPRPPLVNIGHMPVSGDPELREIAERQATEPAPPPAGRKR